ncbi:MAG: AsnC family transcriptional regulator [bacterium]
MSKTLPELDDTDRRILNRIQTEVPLVPRPFQELGREFGLSESEMIERVQRMWDKGIVRRLGPVLNYPAWGMSGVLVASRVSPDRLEDARAAVNEFPEITHAYLRDHEWNLWFTVIAENEKARDYILNKIAERAGLQDVKKLPRIKSFKLGVRFEV